MTKRERLASLVLALMVVPCTVIAAPFLFLLGWLEEGSRGTLLALECIRDLITLILSGIKEAITGVKIDD